MLAQIISNYHTFAYLILCLKVQYDSAFFNADQRISVQLNMQKPMTLVLIWL